MAADSALWWTTLRELLNNVFIEAEEMITRFAREHRKEALQMYKTLYERVVYAEDPQVRVRSYPSLVRRSRHTLTVRPGVFRLARLTLGAPSGEWLELLEGPQTRMNAPPTVSEESAVVQRTLLDLGSHRTNTEWSGTWLWHISRTQTTGSHQCRDGQTGPEGQVKTLGSLCSKGVSSPGRQATDHVRTSTISKTWTCAQG